MNILATNQPLTMSTREIASLLNKNHSDIKRSANRLSDAGILTKPLAESEFKHRGNTYTEYLLEKRDCLILVAQNSPEFTAAIVDRWQEQVNYLIKEEAKQIVEEKFNDVLNNFDEIVEDTRELFDKIIKKKFREMEKENVE